MLKKPWWEEDEEDDEDTWLTEEPKAEPFIPDDILDEDFDEEDTVKR